MLINMQVTVVQMSDGATVVLERVPISPGLAAQLRAFGAGRARSHGNYLPTLDKVTWFMSVQRPCRLLKVDYHGVQGDLLPQTTAILPQHSIPACLIPLDTFFWPIRHGISDQNTQLMAPLSVT